MLVLLLALAIVPLLLNGDGNDDQSGLAGPTPTTGNTGAPAPVVVPASPEEYQAALTSLDNVLTTGIRKVAAARTPATVRNASDALALSVQAESDKLQVINPPDLVAAAHEQLVSALEGFTATISGGSTGTICAGSSATSWMSREAAVNDLRTAAKAVSTADPAHPYKVGTSLPKAAKDATHRLGNGYYLKRTSGGSGQLKIKNGGSSDGVISIVPDKAKQPTIVVYVRGKQNFTVRGVRDGTYILYMTTGTDWDTKAKAFSRDCSFDRFDDSFKFSTTSTSYTIWDITIQAVVGGNATASSVSPDDFPVN